MGQITCVQCGEVVDEAKAFCPGCGHAFVEEEQRQQESRFEQMDSTVQMGKTMYGKMLSDMGLNISETPKAPPKPERRVEVIAPIATAPPSPKPQTSEQPAKKNYLWWIVVALVAVAILLAVLVVLIAVAIMFLNR